MPKAFQFSDLKQLLSQTWTEWNEDNAPRLGAALAYYTTLSIAPLLVVTIAVAGLAFGRAAAEGHIYQQLQGLVGDQGAAAIQSMIQNASKLGSGIFATILGLAALLLGATSVVGELRNALNVIWDVPANQNAGLTAIVKERSYAFGVVLGCGFILLVSLVISSVIAALEKFVGGFLPIPGPALQAINFLVSFLIITGVFAVMYKALPDVKVAWNDVILGAVFTALLFTIGKFVIGIYLGRASFGSTYGAAGSLVIVLVWVYYSAQILFFGAEFTQIYARERGSDPMNKRKEKGKTVQLKPEAEASVRKQAEEGDEDAQKLVKKVEQPHTGEKAKEPSAKQSADTAPAQATPKATTPIAPIKALVKRSEDPAAAARQILIPSSSADSVRDETSLSESIGEKARAIGHDASALAGIWGSAFTDIKRVFQKR